LRDLQLRLNCATPNELKLMMKRMLPEYRPSLGTNGPQTTETGTTGLLGNGTTGYGTTDRRLQTTDHPD